MNNPLVLFFLIFGGSVYVFWVVIGAHPTNFGSVLIISLIFSIVAVTYFVKEEYGAKKSNCDKYSKPRCKDNNKIIDESSKRETDKPSLDLLSDSAYSPEKKFDFTEHLLEQQTIEEAESQNIIMDKRLGEEPIPFGFMHDDWIEFKSLMEMDDQLWTFDDGHWTGYAIVRNGEVVKTLGLEKFW